MARARRGPVIPPERLRPPDLDWSEQLRRERRGTDTAEVTGEAGPEPPVETGTAQRNGSAPDEPPGEPPTAGIASTGAEADPNEPPARAEPGRGSQGADVDEEPELDAPVAPEHVQEERPAPRARTVRPAVPSRQGGPLRLTGFGRRRRSAAVIAGVAALAVLAVTAALVLALQRIPDSRTQSSPASSSPAPLRTTGAPASPLVVSVLGASATGGAAEALPSERLLVNGLQDADVTVRTAPGLRYASEAVDPGPTFEQLVPSVDAASRVVVLFGGRNDRFDGVLRLSAAATRTLRAVHARAPDAKIVVVGPVWTGAGEPPATLLTVRDTLRGAASNSSARFIDPIQERWLQSGAALVGDGDGLTPAGERELARRIAEVVTSPAR